MPLERYPTNLARITEPEAYLDATRIGWELFNAFNLTDLRKRWFKPRFKTVEFKRFKIKSRR